MENNGELKDILARILPTIKLRKITIGAAIIITIGVLASKLTLYPEYIRDAFIILLIWFASVYWFEFLIRKTKTASETSNLYFGYQMVEFFFITLIVYNNGGVEWIGAIFFIFIVVYGNIVLSKFKGLIISTVGCVFYTLLAVLEYFSFIPFRAAYPTGANFYQDLNYLLITIPFVWFTFYFIGWAANLFTDLLRKRTLELDKTKIALEEAKTILEIKVKARTRELRELAEKREEEIQERTKELQDRVKELERFQRLTVGRELKMIELKKKIKELEKKSKGRA